MEKIGECLEKLSLEARELYLESRVRELVRPPSPLVFLRDYVSKNVPVVIRGGCTNWGACKKWSHTYLREKIGENLVTVSWTPNGFADAVYDGWFTLPDEKIMKFKKFLDLLESSKNGDDAEDCGEGGVGEDNNEVSGMPKSRGSQLERGVYYIQKQNSCLTTEYRDLREDVDDSILWAEEAFGCKPDAINFWMGEKDAVTSHVYPVARFKMMKKSKREETIDDNHSNKNNNKNNNHNNRNHHYNNGDDTYTLVDENNTVKWTPVDPINPDLDRYPNYARTRPLEVKVQRGDMLYLPSLWFHHVRQSHGCIAVNYWYDMSYDIKYNYFKLVESLIDLDGAKKMMKQ
ncbi:hypothetical protein HELRODRAFT_170668 [Helobdella robusta]|uniref:JmjC domain-containing protein n=1 Tax=Helobdella robusta TaxID=6412 RepID=T1F3A9_HELRO|nr:hypothetical protein HELRODRAFT_170668 [Helobdella robusta]ESO07337.1 hypothetical protein HELRODRAFT_170668 [Helobdella robusta]